MALRAPTLCAATGKGSKAQHGATCRYSCRKTDFEFQQMSDGDWVRWNTHHSTEVNVDLFGSTFRLSQDPNSNNLGTTVWDASIVFAKYLEKNCKHGELSRARLKGKKAIDLGAGMGLCGFSLAAMGANVISTDLEPVLPLLKKNRDANFSPTVLQGLPWGSNVGDIEVAELDWRNEDERSFFANKGPFNYLAAADCIYNEDHVQAFRDTCIALMDAKSLLIVINEFRSESVHQRFMTLMEDSFHYKKILHSKMSDVQHELIDIYFFKLRKQ